MWVLILFGILFMIALACDKKKSPAKSAAEATLTLVFGVPLMIVFFALAVTWIAENTDTILLIIKIILAFITLIASIKLINKHFPKKISLTRLKKKPTVNSSQLIFSQETSSNKTKASNNNIQKNKSLYQIIGVSDTASQQEIARACRLRIENILNSNDLAAPSMITFINKAERILLNPEKRRQYDEKIKQTQKKSKGYGYIFYPILIAITFISSYLIFKVAQEKILFKLLTTLLI